MTTRKLILAAVLAAGLCAGRAMGTTITSVVSGYWTNTASWTPAQVPASTDDVIIAPGHTNTIATNGSVSVASLTIQAGGVLTHLANNTTEAYKCILNIVSNLTINAGGQINVDAMGYAAMYGPGAATVFGGSVAGSYGGRGAYSTLSQLGTTYGSITSPTNCGSGGRGTGAAGGGAVLLDVGSTAAVHGTITANGGPSTQDDSGSGGTVYLRTGAITGTGTIRANGGYATRFDSGGGGRIAVILTNSADFGAVTLQSYAGTVGNSRYGAGGTVYLEHTGYPAGGGKLIVDYGALPPYDDLEVTTVQNGKGASSNAFYEIVLTNGAIYTLDTNDTLDIRSTIMSASPSNRSDTILLRGGTLQIPSDFGFTNYTIRIVHTNSPFSPASLTVGTNATFRLDVPWTMAPPTLQPGGELTFNMPITLNGSLTIPTGGTVDHTANSSWEAYKLDLTLNGNLDVQAGGIIDVSGKGFAAMYNYGGIYNATYNGGSHGGLGGYNSLTDVVGPTYDSVTYPTNCGSGGRSSAGGGAALLKVTGTTTVNGVISADGGTQPSTGADGSGAGGTVYLRTASVSGSGTIRANGGYTGRDTSGGGGRVAVIVTNATGFDGVSMQAYAGLHGQSSRRGACGTVYTEVQGQGAGRGTLKVDANNIVSATLPTTFIWTNVADKTVGTVIVTNAAKLAVSNDVLTVYGDWRNSATFTGMVNSTVLFAGTNAATIYGTNTFYNFTSTNLNCTQESEAKRLYFQEARTNTVNGVLTLTGVRVDSIGSVNTWGLKANPALTHSVSNVWAGRSDASSGSQITAYDSTNMGENVNWTFPKSGPTINTWLGAVSTVWNVNGNWSEDRPTIETDEVVIPTNGYGNYPVLDVTRRVKSLAISNAASVSLGGFDLTVDIHLIVGGTLTAVGAATIRVGGDLNFSGGGTFNAASSTMWIAGSATQTVVSAGNAFYLLTVSNSAAPVVFADAVTASNLVNMANPVSFGGAVTVASMLRTYGTNVSFGGAVAAGAVDNRDGALVFGGPLTATAFYSANSPLVFSGAVATVTFTNWAGDLTFWDDVTAGAFYSAPGGMTHTFREGKTVTVGTLEWYGGGRYPIVLRSASVGNAWNLAVTGGSRVRQVDVKDSNAAGGQTLYPVASTDSGSNTNWVFDPTWQTWVGTNSVFTNANNWIPALAPGAGTRLLIDGYYSNAPVLSGIATAAQVMVGGVTAATLTVNGQLAVLGDVTVIPSGTITHSANTITEANKLALDVSGNLTVNAGGAINVDGMGYSTFSGPGGAISDAGGSHGGWGAYNAAITECRPTYGSITSPTNCGSGGRSTSGGGAVLLRVTGTTTVDGAISADGAVSSQDQSGAGGSVYLRTAALAGSGTIRANGGYCVRFISGGGGRIAVVLTNSTDIGGVNLQAYAGRADYAGTLKKGACGTVYTEIRGQQPGCGTLKIDGTTIAPAAGCTTLVWTNVTDTTVGTVIITNLAVLEVSNQTLTVCGDWINKATFVAQTNSTVNFAGSTTATIYTNNTFFNFTCTNAGKTLVFEAGKTNTVTGLLKLGASQSGQMVTLQSTVGGSWSYLTLVPGGTQAIARVSVKDSNAGGGQTLLAGGGSANGGNNINWQFPPSGTMFMVK